MWRKGGGGGGGAVVSQPGQDRTNFRPRIKPNNVKETKSKGPVKASYGLPNSNWQMKYEYKSGVQSVRPR